MFTSDKFQALFRQRNHAYWGTVLNLSAHDKISTIFRPKNFKLLKPIKNHILFRQGLLCSTGTYILFRQDLSNRQDTVYKKTRKQENCRDLVGLCYPGRFGFIKVFSDNLQCRFQNVYENYIKVYCCLLSISIMEREIEIDCCQKVTQNTKVDSVHYGRAKIG